MRKLLDIIIRFLGGVPHEDFIRAGRAYALSRELIRVKLFRTYLDMLYGRSSDEWCSQAYSYIQRIEHELEEVAAENDIEVLCEIADDDTPSPAV